MDGSKVYTIEGNTSDQVARRSYYLSNSYIVGYGRPAYDAEPGNANADSQTPSNGTTSEVTYTVVAGVKSHLYDRTAENAAASGLTAITAAKSSFAGCTKLSDYDKIPTTWKE